MDKTSYNLSIIAYYLSEYDLQAVHELGYKTRVEAFEDISIKLGRENNYLKLRRDEFDVLTSSSRKGWQHRPAIKEVQAMYDELSAYDYESITALVKGIISTAIRETEEEINDQLDDKRYVEKVNRAIRCNIGKKNIAKQPKILKENKKYNGTRIARDPTVAANALCNADYKCELCTEHKTFIRKSNGKPYTEPHHLIPMKFQKDFNVSLDVENNIVSLCSNCHNMLHYGADIDAGLEELYNKRNSLLKSAGIFIKLFDLKNYYK